MARREPKITRRSVLQTGAAWVPGTAFVSGAATVPGDAAVSPAESSAAAVRRGNARSATQARHVVVVGAGAFGGWTALSLLRSGARVTLCDSWGPGHTRASSGGESRVIRHAYGEPVYVDWVIRSLDLWEASQQRWERPLYHQAGVLWMAPAGDDFLPGAQRNLETAGVEHELLDATELARRYPQIAVDGIERAIFEPRAGYLLARRGCEAVAEAFIEEGGAYRQAACRLIDAEGGEMRSIGLSDGDSLRADAYVFACGPWLGKLFPDLMGDLITPTRQEVYYFGTPAGTGAYDGGNMPVWADSGGRFWYGIPGGERRGFKMADDERGPVVDPTTQDRQLSAEGVARARAYLEMRFPGMSGAPLIEGRVCQYENSPDGNFIIDRHPLAANAWIVGGGSGHGYKHGPALGEYTARLVLNDGQPEALFSLARFG